MEFFLILVLPCYKLLASCSRSHFWCWLQCFTSGVSFALLLLTVAFRARSWPALWRSGVACWHHFFIQILSFFFKSRHSGQILFSMLGAHVESWYTLVSNLCFALVIDISQIFLIVTEPCSDFLSFPRGCHRTLCAIYFFYCAPQWLL